MTLRKKTSDDLSVGKITILCTIIGTMAALVMATPTIIDFIKFGVSPWITLPARLDAMSADIKDIKHMQEQQLAHKPYIKADK